MDLGDLENLEELCCLFLGFGGSVVLYLNWIFEEGWNFIVGVFLCLRINFFGVILFIYVIFYFRYVCKCIIIVYDCYIFVIFGF